VTFVLQSDHAKFPIWFRWVLAAVWFSGLVLGIFFFYRMSPSFVSLMRGLEISSVSIVGVLVSNLLPFLISAFAVYFHKIWLIFLLAFLKALVFGCSGGLITVAYGAAGWLVRWLTMFTDSIICPALLYFWCRHTSGDHRLCGREVAGYFCFVAFVIWLDFSVVSPFLARII
jgi:hypothetical protein